MNSISFPQFFFANAQKTPILTATSIVPVMTCGTTPEVLGLLQSTLIHCVITKMAQNQEKRAILLPCR